MFWTPLGKKNSRFGAYTIRPHQMENGVVQPTLVGP